MNTPMKCSSPIGWLIFALTVTLVQQGSASTIDTIGAWDGTTEASIFGGGGDISSPTKSYGQVFTLSQAATLNSFTFILQDSLNPEYRPMTFGFYLMSWSATTSRPVGTLLYSSAATTGGMGAFQSFTFNLAALSVDAGQYVAFVSVVDGAGLLAQPSPTGAGFASMAASLFDLYPGGMFVFDPFAATQFSDLTSNSWNDFGAQFDAAFRLDFEAATVDEPDTSAILLSSLAILGIALRRLRAQANRVRVIPNRMRRLRR